MTTYLNTPLQERSILDIPDLLDDIRLIIHDLDQHELKLDPLIYRQLARHATLIQEGLEDVQRNWDGTRVEFSNPIRSWGWNESTSAYRLNIDPDEIIRLSSLGMAEQEMADALGCTRRTLYTRKRELGIGKQLYTDISDEDLEAVSTTAFLLLPVALPSPPNLLAVWLMNHSIFKDVCG
jgi:hypothetical protein